MSLWRTVLYLGLSVSHLVRGWILSRVFRQTGLGEEGPLLLEPMHNSVSSITAILLMSTLCKDGVAGGKAD